MKTETLIASDEGTHSMPLTVHVFRRVDGSMWAQYRWSYGRLERILKLGDVETAGRLRHISDGWSREVSS